MFRYFNLLAPVLGDDLMFTDVDSSVADAALDQIMDADPGFCRFKPVQMNYRSVVHYSKLLFPVPVEQPSTSHLLTDMSRKMPWSDLETRTLLGIWGENDVQLTLRGCQKNRHVFDYISEKMSDRGFTRTNEQCYTRIKRLKYGFVHEKLVTKPTFLLILYTRRHFFVGSL